MKVKIKNEFKDAVKALGFRARWKDGGEEAEKAKREAEEAAAREAAKQGEGGKKLTQEEFDRIYRKMKTVEEKLGKSEMEKVQLVSQVKSFSDRLATVEGQGNEGEPVNDLKKKYAGENFPQSEEEWDDLIAEHPTYGTDLRSKYLRGRNTLTDRQEASRKKAMKEHSDMWLHDENGDFAVNAEGKPLLDMNTEKAKLFCEIANQDPNILNIATGPEMVMAAVVNRLAGKKEADVKTELEKKKAEEEAARQGKVKDGGVASGGQTPPEKKPVKVTFNSDEEKTAAEQAVASGTYKDMEDYCRVRDSRVISGGRGGF